MVEATSDKLEKLRAHIKSKGLDAYVVFHNDAHSVRDKRECNHLGVV